VDGHQNQQQSQGNEECEQSDQRPASGDADEGTQEEEEERENYTYYASDEGPGFSVPGTPGPGLSSSECLSLAQDQQSSQQDAIVYQSHWESLNRMLSVISQSSASSSASESAEEVSIPKKPSISTIDLAETIDYLRSLLVSLHWLRAEDTSILPHPTTSLNSTDTSVTATTTPPGGRRVLEKQRRDQTITALMTWMELSSKDSLVAVGVCGLLMKLTRDERVLGNVLRLLFKLSKNEKNDRAFERFGVVGELHLGVNNIDMHFDLKSNKL
jgi:hypothetical protein